MKSFFWKYKDCIEFITTLFVVLTITAAYFVLWHLHWQSIY